RRMGKSLGNYIGVGESAEEQFGKTMSIPDNLMRDWFALLTDRGTEEIARLTNSEVTNPRQAKEILGKDIVRFYHGERAAEDAADEFRKRFADKQDPNEIPEVPVSAGELKDGNLWVVKLLVLLDMAKSNNEARRLVQGGGVTIGPDREKVTDP